MPSVTELVDFVANDSGIASEEFREHATIVVRRAAASIACYEASELAGTCASSKGEPASLDSFDPAIEEGKDVVLGIDTELSAHFEAEFSELTQTLLLAETPPHHS